MHGGVPGVVRSARRRGEPLVGKAAAGRRGALLLVAVPVIWGGVLTATSHVRFQDTYREIYRVADVSEEPVVVHYPYRDLEDARRGLTIRNDLHAPLAIDVENGGVVARSP